MIVLFIHVIVESIHQRPDHTMEDKTNSPWLLLTISGLAGVPSCSNGLWSRLKIPNLEWRSQGNIKAVRSPMHREVIESTLPMIMDHCQRWGDKTRLALVGHSLGAVDAVWISCRVREMFGDKIRMLTIGVAGAFGTEKNDFLYKCGVHRTIVESISINSAFMQRMQHHSQTLPYHPKSKAVFIMTSLDDIVVPATNSLFYSFPPGHHLRHFALHGVGHGASFMASYPITTDFITKFFCPD